MTTDIRKPLPNRQDLDNGEFWNGTDQGERTDDQRTQRQPERRERDLLAPVLGLVRLVGDRCLVEREVQVDRGGGEQALERHHLWPFPRDHFERTQSFAV